MDKAVFEGGCLCGQARWRATAAPANVRVCHCRECQKATAGPFFARAVFLAEHFSWTGALTTWPSSPRVDRRACARCGAAILATPKDPPARFAVAVATCDAPETLPPECHIWVSEKLGWVTLGDGLPRFERGYVAG